MDDEQVEGLIKEKTDLLRKLGMTGSHIDELVIDNMNRAHQASHNEIRPAGQLLFHNTFFGGDVLQTTVLRGRKKQVKEQAIIRVMISKINHLIFILTFFTNL